VYPSAYANAYASKICAGKIKDPSGVKRKDFRGKKAKGGLMEATARLKRQGFKTGESAPKSNENLQGKQKNKKLRVINVKKIDQFGKIYENEDIRGLGKTAPTRPTKTPNMAKGGRAGYRKGGGVCLRGMNRDAIGKNS
jgi:hypothetical protein